MDQPIPTAVVLAALDLSKAYNRGDSMVIEDLYDMHVPGWLLAIICSYLSERTIILKYQQATSTERSLPGGYGAGTWLGGFLFIIKFNGVCLRPPIPRPLSGNKAIQLKFVDDATKAASINLRKSLEPDQNERPFPLKFCERKQTKKMMKISFGMNSTSFNSKQHKKTDHQPKENLCDVVQLLKKICFPA